jgi:hypothetical protein
MKTRRQKNQALKLPVLTRSSQTARRHRLKPPSGSYLNWKILALWQRESHHPPVLERFAPDAPAPETAEPFTRMAHQLGTQAGRALYKLRKQTMEPVFGIIKRVMDWRQMSMRGLEKAQGEWNLVTMAWNIKRMHVLRAA